MSTAKFLPARFLVVCLFVLGLHQCMTASAVAQIGSYTSDYLNSLKSRNSTSYYSSQRFRNQAFTSARPRESFGARSNLNLFSDFTRSSRPRQKPFSSVNKGSSVTPYLGLTGLDTGAGTNYYNNVRPRLEQERMSQQYQRDRATLQHRLNQMAAQAPYSLKGSETIAPTGHAAVFMNYGGYYQMAQ